MTKSFLLIMVSVALSFSMITPTLNSLFDFGMETSVLVDFSEEEPNKGENEINGNDIVLTTYDKFEPFYASQFNKLVGFYVEDASTFNKKVILPPPERIS